MAKIYYSGDKKPINFEDYRYKKFGASFTSKQNREAFTMYVREYGINKIEISNGNT